QALATVIQAQGEQAQFGGLAIDGGTTITAGDIEPYTNTVIGQAPGKVTGHIGLITRADPGADLVQRLIGRAFGYDVDGATQPAATWCGTIEKGIGAAQYLHPFDQLCAQVLPGQ